MANDGTIRIGVELDTAALKSELNNLSKKGIAGLGNAISKTFSVATKSIAGVSAGIAGISAASISVGKDFEVAMSKVQATSGASAEDLKLLEQKALEMGSSTVFSASESAEALNYMAMAGWKTEDMLEGLPGIMDLAAASGEDLAMVSDILTDGLTAFGMSANESGRFADVLAVASSNANTNVAMLGESFKYAAPVAGALGYSVEDTAVALGLMANAGIKASSSGTALRTLMTNLASPTKSSAVAMEKLGINLQDAQGNMLPFNDVIGQLRDGFSGLTEAEKAQYAEMLAGKEGMSGLLAIVNASEADFEKLTGAINNSSGAAAEMADIMSDNLEGRLKQLSSALEGFMITIYQNLKEPLKEMTEYATELVTQLQQAFEQGGFEGLVNSLGGVFSKILTDIASQAPQIIEIASQFISSFLEGINQNSEQLGQAAVDIVMSLVNGFFENLPLFIETGSNLLGSFIDGMISSIEENKELILEKVDEIIDSLLNSIDNLVPGLKPVTDAIRGLKDNMDKVIPVVAGLTAAFIAYKTAMGISTLITMVTNGISALRTATDGMKLSQIALNAVMNANPFVLITTLIAGVVTALITLWNTNEDFRNAVLKIWNDIKTGISNVVENIKTFFTETIPNAWQEFLDFFKELPDKTLTIGEDVVKGFWEGIKSMGSWLKDKLFGWVDGIINNVKSFFGIHSPSRVFRDEVGKMLVQGTIVGVENENGKLVDAIIEPYDEISGKLSSRNNLFSNNIVNLIAEGRKKAEKEAKSYSEIGEIISNSILESVKNDKEELLNSVSKNIEEILNENIKNTEKSGEDLIKSYTKKIEDESNSKISNLEENAEKLINSYTEKIEKEVEKGKISTKEQGKKLIKSYTDNIKKKTNEEKKAIKENAKELINNYSSEIKEQTKIQKEDLKKSSDDLLNIFKNSIETGTEQINQLINEKIGGLTSEYQKKFDELISAQQNLENKLSNTKLFEFKDDELVIEDLDKTIDKLEEYDKAISKLKEKGISDTILGEISNYSIDDALKITEKLLKMTNSEFEKLNNKWAEKQELATKVASNFYKEQMEVLEKEFNEELLNTLNELPTQIEDIGIMAITGFQDGITSKMDIIKDNVRGFAESIIGTMQSALDIHSPSRKMMWVGKMVDDGLAKGINDNKKGVLNSIKNLGILESFKNQLGYVKYMVANGVNNMIPKSSYINNTSNNTNNITNKQGDLNFYITGFENKGNGSIKTLMEEASFFQKQRELAKGGVY